MLGKINIVLTGVGGQGVITAAKILGKAAINANVNVLVSEIHGMAQRGGSVICMIRMGNISGSIIPNGAADAIISTEPIEALRYIKYSNKDTKIISDINSIIPFTVSVGTDKYPEIDKVFEELNRFGNLYKINAVQISKEAGAIITKNIVLLGALSALNILNYKSEILLNTILDNVPPKSKEVNKRAFQGGFNFIKNVQK